MDFTLTPEQEELRERAHAAGAEFREANARWDEEDDAPYDEVAQRMGDLGFFGLTMPPEYGGQGKTALEYLIATTAIFRASQGWVCCEPLFCTSGPGPSMVLLGETPARDKFLPDLVSGRKGCAIALSEPKHGSDLTHLETTAVIDGDDVVVNGEKAWVTGSGVNQLFAVFARFDGIPRAKGVGCVIVEREAEGVTVDRGPRFAGLRGLAHGDLTMRDVRVPVDNIIAGAGGFARLMSAFNMERLHNTALSLGLMESSFDEASAYVRERIAFDRPVIEFQDVYHRLADMYVTTEAHRLLAYRAAASAVDGNFPDALATTTAKLFGSTAVPQVTLKSMELHGGYGTTMDYPIQRLHRDAVSAVVAGGAPAVLRNSIASMLFPDVRFPQTRG